MAAGDAADRAENASSVAFPPGIRVASSGAHDFVAVGGASALGSVARFGSIAPQAVNITAKLASDTLSRALRVDLGKRGATEDRVGVVSAPALPCDRFGGDRARRRPGARGDLVCGRWR